MYLLGLSLVLLALKYFEIGPVAAWSWWWVLSPLWGGLALVIAVMVVCFLLALAFSGRGRR